MSNLFRYGLAVPQEVDKPNGELSPLSIHDEMAPCPPDHPYVRAHKIEDMPSHIYVGFHGGLNGAVAVKMYNVEGWHVDTMLVLRAKNGTESQKFINNLVTLGCFARIGLPQFGTLLIANDFASGVSIHLATGHAVAVAGEEHNLSHVCKALAGAYPDHKRVLCLNSSPSEELLSVADSSGTQMLCLNEAVNGSIYSSFNDLHVKMGLDAVAQRVLRAVGDLVGVGLGIDSQAEMPWPHPVSGRYLFKKLIRRIKRHTILSQQQAIAVALWIVFTYAIPGARIAPILLISSPVRRCGKSTLGALLGFLVNRTLQSSSITAAALYREIDEQSPTVLIDEADRFLEGASELIGIINSGHTRHAAFATRTVGGRSKRFRTFCAKVLMMIGRPAETILDRSIVISLARKRADQKVERLAITPTRELTILKAQISRWVDDHRSQIQQATFEPPELANDRAADNWEPLLAIAQCIGDEWYEAALDAAIELSRPLEDPPSLDELLLADIKQVFTRTRQKNVSSAELTRALCADPEKLWGTVDRGRPLSQNFLAKRLGKFGIRSINIRHTQGVAKGYELAQFADAFARYVVEHSS